MAVITEPVHAEAQLGMNDTVELHICIMVCGKLLCAALMVLLE